MNIFKKIYLKIKRKARKNIDKKYRDEIINLIKIRPVKRFLDCGCGNAEFSIKVAEMVNAKELYGLDFNNLAKDKRKSIKVVKSDLNKKFPFPASYFDVVISSFVIEHIFDTDNFVTEIKRILKPGGVTIHGTENLSALHNIFALLMGKQPFAGGCSISTKYYLGNSWLSKNKTPILYNKGETPHLRLFAPEGLKDIFEIYGFKNIKVKGVGLGISGGFISSLFLKLFKHYGSFIIIKCEK